jgi:hypothetical protein
LKKTCRYNLIRFLEEEKEEATEEERGGGKEEGEEEEEEKEVVGYGRGLSGEPWYLKSGKKKERKEEEEEEKVRLGTHKKPTLRLRFTGNNTKRWDNTVKFIRISRLGTKHGKNTRNCTRSCTN